MYVRTFGRRRLGWIKRFCRHEILRIQRHDEDVIAVCRIAAGRETRLDQQPVSMNICRVHAQECAAWVLRVFGVQNRRQMVDQADLQDIAGLQLQSGPAIKIAFMAGRAPICAIAWPPAVFINPAFGFASSGEVISRSKCGNRCRFGNEKQVQLLRLRAYQTTSPSVLRGRSEAQRFREVAFGFGAGGGPSSRHHQNAQREGPAASDNPRRDAHRIYPRRRRPGSTRCDNLQFKEE